MPGDLIPLFEETESALLLEALYGLLRAKEQLLGEVNDQLENLGRPLLKLEDLGIPTLRRLLQRLGARDVGEPPPEDWRWISKQVQ